MKINTRLFIAPLILFLASNLSAQLITNDVTLSITYSYEANGYSKGNLYIIPSPVVKTFSTADLITQMAKCRQQIVPKGAKLQIAMDTNDNVFPQVKNSNSTVVDVSDLVTIAPGTNGLSSGTINMSTTASTVNNFGLLKMQYDDTSLNNSNGISFSFEALSSFDVSLTPKKPATTNNTGIYSVKNTITITSGIGDGYALNTNGGTNVFIIKNATMNCSGSGSLSLNFNQ